jgi:2'-5' RNA ligase
MMATFDRIRDELGEKISKVAEVEEDYVPPIGSIWTMSDPWAQTRNPPGPLTHTVQVQDIQETYGSSGYIWYKDLDSQTGKDQQDGMSVRMWNDKMHRGIIWQRGTEWSFQESPEEAAEYWPDTLPEGWKMTKQAATLRLFIAFDPPDETVQQIIQWQQQNAPEGVRLHTPDMLHMTLAFLGNVEETEVPRLLQIINSLDPSSVTISGPQHYEEIRGKQGVLVWQESGGNAVWQQLNQLLHEWSGYTPQYEPWLPHTTVWEYPGGTGEGYTPQIPVIPAWSPIRVGLYKSEKAPEGGGRFTLITKTADDLSWVDKSTPYGTPAGGFIGGPEHWGDDSIDLPSEPGRDLKPLDNENVHDPKGSLKVIYDFERDQIILGDVRKAEQFPPGQIIGDYRDGDVYLNSHAEAWFNANYFKRLWQHSFPKRPIRHVILDKGDGQHEIVHRHPTSAILGTYEDHQEDQAGLEERRQGDDQAQPQGAEPLQVVAVDEYGEYYWPSPEEIMQAGVDSVEATGQPHPGFRQGAEAAIDSARGAAINRHLGMFGMGGSNDPYELAGHLIWRIQATQMAIDGNKRMAATTGLSWLSMHGYDVSHLPQDDTFFKVVEQAATLTEDEGPELIADFLRQHVTEEDG